MTFDNKTQEKSKNSSTALTEQQQRYLHYHQVKWINMNIWIYP